MNNIVNYVYVSSILDTSVLPRGSASDVYELLACTDPTTDQVCHSSDGSDTISIDDSEAWGDLIDWIVNDQHLAASEQVVTAILSAGCDQTAHTFRAGEVAKIVAYYNLYACSSYGALGYPAADVWSGQVAAIGNLVPALDAFGEATLEYAEGYTIPVSRYQQGQGALAPYGRFGVVTTNQPSATWGITQTSRTNGGTKPTSYIVHSAATITVQYLGHDGNLIESTYTVDMGQQSKSVPRGAVIGYNMYSRSYVTSVEGTNTLKFEYYVSGLDYVSNGALNTGTPVSFTTYDVALRNDVPLVSFSVAFSVYDDVHHTNWAVTNVANGTKLHNEVTYMPSVRYDGVEPITYPITVQGVSVTVEGEYTDDATFSIDGQASATVVMQYRAVQGTAAYPLSGAITVPSHVSMSADPRVKLAFTDEGHPGIEIAKAAGAGAVIDTAQQLVDATATAKAAVSNYDRQSVWESFSDLTAQDLQVIFGDRRVINDYYLISQMEYTVMQMNSDTIRDLREFMASDDGVLTSSWGLDFFADASVDTSGMTVDSWCRVRLADETVYYDVSDLPEDIGLVYQNGVLSATESAVGVHIERFVYQGRCLDEWFSQRESRNELSDVLAEAAIDTNTQLLMRIVAMSANQATDWLSQAGQVLKDIVNSARNEAMDILQLAPYNVITVPQRKAISGSIGAVSIPATYVADMVETAASLGATSCDQVLNLLDQIPAGSGTTVTSVQYAPSATLLDTIVRMSPFAGYQLHCTEQRKTVSVEVPYWTSFVQRLGSSIISAGGVDSEFADLGSGACAIFPPLINGTINVPDLALGLSNPIILPMEASLAVVYPSHIQGQYTVAWFARYYGGSDYDALSCINASWAELGRILNAIGSDFDFSYAPPTFDDVSDADNYDWSTLAGTFASTAMGAVTGAMAGSAGGIQGTILGAGVGACVAELGCVLATIADDSNAEMNMRYRMARMSGKAGSLTMNGTQTTDSNVIGQLMASLMMACVKHGAFYPYGSREGGDLINSNRYAITCGSNPYFRYAFVGEHEDYTPLMLTAATALTAISARTNLKALRHPTYDPAFLPVAVAGGLATAAQSTTALAMERAAARRAPTLAMQQEILDAVETVGVTEGGVYTDAQGSVTLRDLASELDNVKQKINSIDQSVSNQDAFSTY